MNNLQMIAKFNKNTISFSAADKREPVTIGGLFIGTIGGHEVSGHVKHARGSANIKGAFVSKTGIAFVLEGKISYNKQFNGFLTQAVGGQNKKINVSGIWNNGEIIFTSNALNAKLTKQTGGN